MPGYTLVVLCAFLHLGCGNNHKKVCNTASLGGIFWQYNSWGNKKMPCTVDIHPHPFALHFIFAFWMQLLVGGSPIAHVSSFLSSAEGFKLPDCWESSEFSLSEIILQYFLAVCRVIMTVKQEVSDVYIVTCYVLQVTILRQEQLAHLNQHYKINYHTSNTASR